jgi:hypothetical protein
MVNSYAQNHVKLHPPLETIITILNSVIMMMMIIMMTIMMISTYCLGKNTKSLHFRSQLQHETARVTP